MPVTTFDRSRIRDVQLLLIKKRGHVASAAEDLRVSRSTLNAWISMTPELKETIQDIKDTRLDSIILMLEMEAINNSNMTAARMLLEGPDGRDRGWGATQEINHTGIPESSDDPLRIILRKMPVSDLRQLAKHADNILPAGVILKTPPRSNGNG